MAMAMLVMINLLIMSRLDLQLHSEPKDPDLHPPEEEEMKRPINIMSLLTNHLLRT